MSHLRCDSVLSFHPVRAANVRTAAQGGVATAWREADLLEDEQQQLEAPRDMPAKEESARRSATQQLSYDSDDGWGDWGEPVRLSAAMDGESALMDDDALLSSGEAAMDDTRQSAEAEVVRRCSQRSCILRQLMSTFPRGTPG